MSEHVKFAAKSGAERSGELGLPKGDKKAPGLILVQEWWGINDHIKSLVARFADEGFLVLAPDLYFGKVAKDAGEAQTMMTELDGMSAMDAIAGAAKYLQGHARSTGKVGITGFCMGGAYAFAATCHVPEIAAAVPFYGIPPEKNVDWAKVKAPIQAHFAQRDQWATVALAEGIKTVLDAKGASMELCTYDSEHAFMNDTRPEVFDPASAKIAWRRAVEFLHTHLG